jgi:hypothetical protein
MWAVRPMIILWGTICGILLQLLDWAVSPIAAFFDAR